MRSTARSSLALIFAVTTWSLAPLWIVNARGLVPAPVAAMLSLMTATALAVLVSSFSRKYHVLAAFRATRERHLLITAAGVGGLAFFAYPLLYFSALQMGPPLLVNLVNYLWPIIGLLMASAIRRETAALEVLMAAAFGFAGAALAILNNSETGPLASGLASPLPFALAALGAIAYGAMSAFMNATAPRQEGPRGVQFFLVALCFGGIACGLTFGAVALVSPESLTFHPSRGHLEALVVYALLHPFSHLCWLTAIQDRRIPGFTSTFLVPVFSTVVLAVAAHGLIGPRIVAALTLVLCGILFSAVRDRGVPVVFATTLAGTGSLLVSVSLPYPTGGDEMFSATDILVGLFAIFGGFVLTNSIARYANLQQACEAFYSRARSLIDGGTTQREVVVDNLDRLDRRVIASARLDQEPAEQGPVARPLSGLSREWARVDLALSSRVSPYEWLVLLLGASGVVLAMHSAAMGDQRLTMSLVRALVTAVVVGLLFAVRDYDLNRPNRVVSNLTTLHHHFDVPISADSTLAVTVDNQRERQIDWTALALVFLVAASIVSVILNLQ
ncbi:hypothetical protein Rhe02_46510 [Rhizocola hellebori]|uniref:DMT family transporter n=2 Tax=Rhizocola hellebori TaxID=1392758 RepID=A0A8J3Q9J6_9ACTN|nr:DMT family transporter [Rhizocola hellebori]GIH06584.1 hypothetical protein Rhe02_46510 [Rhizocola hellebori]